MSGCHMPSQCTCKCHVSQNDCCEQCNCKLQDILNRSSIEYYEKHVFPKQETITIKKDLWDEILGYKKRVELLEQKVDYMKAFLNI